MGPKWISNFVVWGHLCNISMSWSRDKIITHHQNSDLWCLIHMTHHHAIAVQLFCTNEWLYDIRISIMATCRDLKQCQSISAYIYNSREVTFSVWMSALQPHPEKQEERVGDSSSYLMYFLPVLCNHTNAQDVQNTSSKLIVWVNKGQIPN